MRISALSPCGGWSEGSLSTSWQAGAGMGMKVARSSKRASDFSLTLPFRVWVVCVGAESFGVTLCSLCVKSDTQVACGSLGQIT